MDAIHPLLSSPAFIHSTSSTYFAAVATEVDAELASAVGDGDDVPLLDPKEIDPLDFRPPSPIESKAGEGTRVIPLVGSFISKEEYLPSRLKIFLKQFLQYNCPLICATMDIVIVVLHSMHLKQVL